MFNNIWKSDVLIVLICLLKCFDVVSQVTTVDSNEISILNEYKYRLQLFEKQAFEDSIQNEVLQTKLGELQMNDSVLREQLGDMLYQLKEKETARLLAKKLQIDSFRSITSSYPVLGYFSDTLFQIYCRIGSFSAEDRARAISNKLKSLAKDSGFKADSLMLTEVENYSELSIGGMVIMSISDDDAIWNNSSRQELALKYKSRIEDARAHYLQETTSRSMLNKIALSILILAFLQLIWYYLGRFTNWLINKLKDQKFRFVKGLKFRNYILIDANKEISLISGVLIGFKWFAYLLSAYLSLSFIFGLFPWSKGFARKLIHYILDPLSSFTESLWANLPNWIAIFVILFLFKYVFRLLRYFRLEIERDRLVLPGFYKEWAAPTHQLIRILFFALMLVMIFPYIPGNESPVFRGISVFIGFLVTFGSWGSMANIMAGIVMTYMRLFNIGDRVKIGEVVGDVVEKGLFVCRIKTIKNEIISIPNSSVMNNHTINFSSQAAKRGLILYTSVTIGYDQPWKKVHHALITAANRTEFILNEPEPFVLQTSLNDFFVTYQINAFTREACKQAEIYSMLHENIQDVFFESGIEIMSPHYNSLRDGNKTTIPESYLPGGYHQKGFQLDVNKDKL